MKSNRNVILSLDATFIKERACCCHSARRNYGNAGIVEEGTDAARISRSGSGEDNPQTDPNKQFFRMSI